MVDTIQKTFIEIVKTVLRTERAHGFRLCIDNKDNISVAKGGPFGAFVGYDNPICPSDTKKILDIIITPGIVKTAEIANKIKQIKDEFPPSYQPDDEEIINDALELYLAGLHPV